MNRLPLLALVGILFSCAGSPAHGQFYGYGYPGGFAPGFGGFYPHPYGYGGFGYGGLGYGGFAAGNSINGFVPPPYGMPIANPYVGYPGFGWWPMFASDVKVTAVPARDVQGQSQFVPDASATAPQQQQASSAVVPSGAEIKLICPKDAGKSLTYSLNGNPYTIHPGYSQVFRDDRAWKLEFQRNSESADIVTYTLKPGKYNFGIGSNGWELRQVVIVPVGELPPAPQPMPVDVPSPGPTPVPERTSQT